MTRRIPDEAYAAEVREVITGSVIVDIDLAPVAVAPIRQVGAATDTSDETLLRVLDGLREL